MDPTGLGFPFIATSSGTGDQSPTKLSPVKSPKRSKSYYMSPKLPLPQASSASSPSSPTTLSRKRNLITHKENNDSNVKAPDLEDQQDKRIKTAFQQALPESPAHKPATPRFRDTSKQYKTKSPITVEYSEDFVKSDFFLFHGKKYPIQMIGEGTWHCVYKFLEETTIEIEGKQLKTSQLIVKVPNQKIKKPSQLKTALKEDILAYSNMLKKKIPMPECYVNPANFEDKANPAIGSYWIFKKMACSVSCKGWQNNESLEGLCPNDQKILNFVKKYLTQSAIEEKEIIYGLYPRNIMLDDEGNPNVVDISLSSGDDFNECLFEYLITWSNCNENIYRFLTSEFPEKVKATMEAFLVAKKSECNGLFPVSSQTNRNDEK